jgi:hypothetical protein
MRAHLEKLTAANRDAGMSSKEAYQAALRQFGNVSSCPPSAIDGS